MSTHYDAIVIGSGQAGHFLAVRMAEAGMKTALIEREHLGGTCVNDGCTPTKTMVASARVAHLARRAAEFGVTIGGPISVDMAAVRARKDRIVTESTTTLATWLADAFHVAMRIPLWAVGGTAVLVLGIALLSGLIALRSLNRAEPATLLR